jgi:HlyD family secretion protein
MDKTKSEHINIMVAFSTFLVIVTGVALIGYYVFGNEPEEIQGQVDCREYNVSSKIQGRIARLYVEEGDYIHVGDTLAVLEAPEVDAQQRAAQAAEGAAQAISEMTDNGSRKEQISTAAELLRQAQAARTIAYKSYQRVKNLYDAGVASAQKCDEARAAFDAATAQVGAARSQYEMAVNGSRREEKRAAADQARAAKSGVDVVRSLLKETVQVSAVEGEVDKIYAHTGELVGNGSPIMTVNLLDDVWGKFNIREDHLEGIRQGSIITAYSPAFKKEYRLKVYYMKGEDEYATWKSTKADKDYDLKTFEIRARPVERNKELRPGMLLIKK